MKHDTFDALTKAKAALETALGNECPHEERHRGGTLWTFCSACDAKWADNRGGYKPNPRIVQYEEALGAIEKVLERTKE